MDEEVRLREERNIRKEEELRVLEKTLTEMLINND
jgi:hypothetical protein